MSTSTYRAALARLKAALDEVQPGYSRCGLCGWPDNRHRRVDASTGALVAGDSVVAVGEDYGLTPVEAGVLAALSLAADPRLHGLTQARALEVAEEVYADVER